MNNCESRFAGSLFVQAIPCLIMNLMHIMRLSIRPLMQLMLLMQLLLTHPRIHTEKPW